MKVSIKGASPFLGLFDDNSEESLLLTPRWSRNPDDLMKWLSDGYRYRFNQLRSRRNKWQYYEPANVEEKIKELVPIGTRVDGRSEKQTRTEESFIDSIPSTVLGHPQQTESTEWFAATKRRATLKAKGSAPGAMPRFRKRNKEDIRFGCWYNKGRNAVFYKTGQKTGIVTIKGQNSKNNKRPGEKLGQKFTIRIHVRVTEPIREYTSVQINWTTKTLIFVNPPKNLKDINPTGAAVGLDAGVVHAYSSSDNEVFDLPVNNLKELESRIKFHQKRMSKSRKIAEKEGRIFWEAKGYLLHRAAAAKLFKKAVNVRNDAWHKITTYLVRTYDYIIIEDLNLKNMTKSASGTTKQPGKNVAQKRGLNRAMQRMAIGVAKEQLTYKTEVNGKNLIMVKPHYSSQECSECGHTDKGNRKSQAVFSCLMCNHSENADMNAAKNILHRGFEALSKQTNRGGLPLTGSKHKTGEVSRDDLAAALNREPVSD